jgi:hypothetical protein
MSSKEILGKEELKPRSGAMFMDVQIPKGRVYDPISLDCYDGFINYRVTKQGPRHFFPIAIRGYRE